jgi:hypothetical protein
MLDAFNWRMSHQSHPDSREPIRPTPIIPIRAADKPIPDDSEHEASGVHDAHHFGFWIAEHAPDDATFLPPERRPLSLRSIRSWTVASLFGWVAVGALVAAALSGGPARRPGSGAAAKRIDSIVAQPPIAPKAPPPKVGIPLESLPLVRDVPHRSSLASRRDPTHAAVSSPAAARAAEPSATSTPSSSHALRTGGAQASTPAKAAPTKRKAPEFRPTGI